MMHKNLNLYCSDTNADNIIKHYDSIDKINNLSYIEIEKGIVHPFKLNDSNAQFFGGWYGGVSDREFNIIDEGCLYWENNSLACGKVYRKQIDEYIDKEVIFLGLYMGHFGHCITDGLNKLWFLLKNNSINNYCYISQVDSDDYYNLFKLFGIKSENIIRITKNTQFKKIIIPFASMRLYDKYSDEYKETINKICNNIKPSKDKKIYISRTRDVIASTQTIGEENIENIFKKNGFKILYPAFEKLETVISYMKGAEIVAGVVGTNMHNILFAKDNIKTINLNRSNNIIKFQIVIDKMKNNEAYYVDSYYQPIPTNTLSAVPFLIYPTNYTKKFFKDFGIKYNINRKKLYKQFSFDLTKYLYQYHKSVYNNIDNDTSVIKNVDLVNSLKIIFNDYPIDKVIKTKKQKKDIIDKIAWWIPVRKLRDNFRSKFKH